VVRNLLDILLQRIALYSGARGGPGIQTRYVRRLLSLLVLALLFAAGELLASGDGARVHSPAPVGVNIFVFHASALNDANRSFDPSLITPLLKFDTSIATIQYARTVDVAGRFVMFTGLLRGGQSTRKSKDPEQNASSSGLADPTIAASLNLVGLPPMALDEFRSFKPTTTVNLFMAVTLPLGEYDPLNLVNLGANRFAFRVGLPIVHPVELFPGKKTTLELVPNLIVFSENRDKNLKQDPLLTIEGNLTQDFAERIWGAVGFLYTRGGKTKINGKVQNGKQKSLSLSMALNYDFSPRWSLNFRYGETVARNEFGLEGSLYHLKLITRF